MTTASSVCGCFANYYPSTATERERVLRLIELHGDLQAFRRVAEVRKALSGRSGGVSAGRESAS